jgi:hypothetical protein
MISSSSFFRRRGARALCAPGVLDLYVLGHNVPSQTPPGS